MLGFHSNKLTVVKKMNSSFQDANHALIMSHIVNNHAWMTENQTESASY